MAFAPVTFCNKCADVAAKARLHNTPSRAPDGATRTQRQLGHRRLTLRRLIGIRTTIRSLTIWESIIQDKTK